MKGLHDDPAIYPTLPGRMVDANLREPFDTCWEYVLSHQLTEAEGAAFWTAANLVYKAMGGGRT